MLVSLKPPSFLCCYYHRQIRSSYTKGAAIVQIYVCVRTKVSTCINSALATVWHKAHLEGCSAGLDAPSEQRSATSRDTAKEAAHITTPKSCSPLRCLARQAWGPGVQRVRRAAQACHWLTLPAPQCRQHHRILAPTKILIK